VAQLPTGAAESVRHSAAAGLHVPINSAPGVRPHRRRQERFHGRPVRFPDRRKCPRCRRGDRRPT